MPRLTGFRRVTLLRDEQAIDAIYEAPGTTSVLYLANVGKRKVAVQFTVERSDQGCLDALETAAGTIQRAVQAHIKGAD